MFHNDINFNTIAGLMKNINPQMIYLHLILTKKNWTFFEL